ncbi:DUF4097 domain-containing protein [Aminipila butyrica]|uniref:DUF4097 domain-containing protein n=1 Tax=Aminipila butyrica TaxID=433296 RepID=A0A858BUB0_9FIRM|nr:DUF4097 family beta strand repeat-containing protein [Aminipila butyrica]QIB68779.1 DUF4097 domain-containing protein [Aminipila butyrica]
MNKKIKICIMVCTCLIVVGGCLAGIGLMLGATGSVDMNRFAFHLGGGDTPFSIGAEEADHLYKLSGEVVTDSKEISQPIQVIKTNIGLGGVKIVASDKSEVVYTYDKGLGKPDINVSDGTLTIEDKFGKQHINFSKKMKNKNGIEYIICCPEGTTLQLVQVENSLGYIDISGIKTETLDLKLSAGEVKLADVEAGDLKADVTLGDLKTENLRTEALDLNCDAGDITAAGTLKGKSNFTADLGDIEIKTTLKKEEYSFDLDTQLGDVTVEGNQSGRSSLTDNSAENYLKVKTTAGDISIDFD